MMGEFPNIPRHYTALAEWLACVVVIWPLAKRKLPVNWWVFALGSGVIQIALQHLAGMLPLYGWIFGMIFNIIWMGVTIFSLTNLSFRHVVFLTCKAFIIAEFAAAISWQLYCQLLWVQESTTTAKEVLFLAGSFITIYSMFCLIELRLANKTTELVFRSKDIMLAIITGLIIFSISNIGFLLSATSYNLGDSIAVFSIRTVVNLSGICILYLQQLQRNEESLRRELVAIRNVFQSQYEQYLAYEENKTIINRKAHDLKHQIDVIRGEKDKEKQEAYLLEMQVALDNLSAQIETGHPVLDTILTRSNQYCLEHKITLSCLVDGRLLNFMDIMDICSLFGNALDNAIESVIKLEDTEKRLINLKVTEKNNFILMRLENYSLTDLNFVDGVPVTTKENREHHGFGIKSISHVVLNYQGNMTLNYQDNWFTLNVLIPKTKTKI